MEQNVMIRLSPEATMITDEKKTGVTMDGCKIWAKDSVQAALLREIRSQPKTVDEMKQVAHSSRDGPDGEAFDALALVDFIVTFGNAIANG